MNNQNSKKEISRGKVFWICIITALILMFLYGIYAHSAAIIIFSTLSICFGATFITKLYDQKEPANRWSSILFMFLIFSTISAYRFYVVFTDKGKNNSNAYKPIVEEKKQESHNHDKKRFAGDKHQVYYSEGKELIPDFKYEILYSHNDIRYDGNPYLLVLIDPVNLKKDNFKDNVRLVIDAIAKTHGTKLNIDIYDDREVLNMMNNSDEINREHGKKLSKAQYRKLSRHNIAMFIGEVDEMPNRYDLSFFPSGFYADKEVEKYSDDENYEPSIN